MTQPRTFSEVALCHLPDSEIAQIYLQEGITTIYKNEAGFFIWAKSQYPKNCPVLTQILTSAATDYVLFDVDVEPDPDLEIYDD